MAPLPSSAPEPAGRSPDLGSLPRGDGGELGRPAAKRAAPWAAAAAFCIAAAGAVVSQRASPPAAPEAPKPALQAPAPQRAAPPEQPELRPFSPAAEPKTCDPRAVSFQSAYAGQRVLGVPAAWQERGDGRQVHWKSALPREQLSELPSEPCP